MAPLRAGDRVWVWETEAWVEAKVVGYVDGGGVRVRGQGGRETTAQDEHVHPAAPAGQDGPDSLSMLLAINLPSSLHALRLRFNGGSLCTSAGRVLVVFSSGAAGQRLGVNSSLEGAASLPGRLESAAAEALVRMRATESSQMLLCFGEAGSGKTHAARQLCASLLAVAGAPRELRATLEHAQRVLALFTETQTRRSRASSRAALATSIRFSPPSPHQRLAAVELEASLPDWSILRGAPSAAGLAPAPAPDGVRRPAAAAPRVFAALALAARLGRRGRSDAICAAAARAVPPSDSAEGAGDVEGTEADLEALTAGLEALGAPAEERAGVVRALAAAALLATGRGADAAGAGALLQCAALADAEAGTRAGAGAALYWLVVGPRSPRSLPRRKVRRARRARRAGLRCRWWTRGGGKRAGRAGAGRPAGWTHCWSTRRRTRRRRRSAARCARTLLRRARI